MNEQSPTTPSTTSADQNPTAPTSSPDTPAATTATTPVESSQPKARKNQPDELVIRGFPKVIFFWPTALFSLIFYFVNGGWWESQVTSLDNVLGFWWLFTFTFNMLIFTFDFGRGNFITFITLLGMVVLGLTAWDQASDTVVWNSIYEFFATLNVAMNSNFYLSLFVILGVLIGLALLRSRFDYWVMSSNELIHKHGLLGDVRGYSTLNMHVEKEIPDVFEWILFGSGKLIFKPGGMRGEKQDVLIVENVFRVNNAEARVKRYLGTLRVDDSSE